MPVVPCLLCHSSEVELLGTYDTISYWKCDNCSTVFKDRSVFLDAESEKGRYLLHENDVEDPNYQNFVAPIVKRITDTFRQGASGLDFGAGTGPVISKLLSEKGYSMQLYDPFFHPKTTVLSETYDFIVSCEVIEHFHRPLKEFKVLYNLIRPGGVLFCMTELLPKKQSFETWYYKNDPTHVVFYSEENLQWIRSHLGFSSLKIEGRLSYFTK
ncbi:class I SAM-dependent methyltransferase [Altibacter sp.]|uniref:class I SAM-dependent methyltransferase n=1 Tax=Altibacter sp. TaxID=2024823 RepID=UPI000C8C2278|nr:class I SAM-dependent methyltransferase [Altibacter sp.]MAP53409.1 methyltransferase [Altibacter sp.]